MSRSLGNRIDDFEYLNVENPRMLRVARAWSRVKYCASGRRSLASHSRLLTNSFAARFHARERACESSAVFAVACSTTIRGLDTSSRIVYSSDATARLMLNYYPAFKGLSQSSIREIEACEQASIDRSDLLIYPTEWAAQSAIQDYGADSSKVCVIPYGANLLEEPVVDGVDRPINSGQLRLLFVGVDWRIKGGDIALRCLRQIRASGIDCSLTICGCVPPTPTVPDGVTVIPFLDKNIKTDRDRLDKIYRESDFFLLPTRCECFGIVFCEASAYGLPSIATNTGGVPGVVRDNINGRLVSSEDDGVKFAEEIISLHSNQEKYKELRVTSRQLFEESLNWDMWADRTIAAMLKTGIEFQVKG
jgi:glycosyltransferase involved in cell wall biosynthesis